MKLVVLTPLLLDDRYLQVGAVVELADEVAQRLIEDGLVAKPAVEKAPRGKSTPVAEG